MAPRHVWLLLAAGCAAPAQQGSPKWLSPLLFDHPLTGTIYDVAAGAAIDEAALRQRVLAKDLVALGEIHDNADHHRLQARVIEWLDAAGRRPSVVFEMLAAADQGKVDAAVAASKDPDAFALAVDWAASGWPDWSLYRPLFAAALAHGAAIVAANIPRREAMDLAAGKTQLDPALATRYGLDRPPQPEVLDAMRRELDESHCGHFPAEMLDPMVLIQRARDAQLAERVRTAAPRPVVLIAGGGHTRTDRGVPSYLAQQGETSVLSIGFVQVSEEGRVPADYAADFDAAVLPFDIVWFTPRANDINHCAELEQRMHQKAAGGGAG